MSNENKSIHEFDFSLICEYFSSVERQGPGSAETTIKALSFVEGLTDKSLIADLGCTLEKYSQIKLKSNS